MKYWLNHLPLEVWVDCYRYPGITREQMGQIVDRIGNLKYGEYLQFYLHDWGKRMLKPIHFRQPPFKAIPQTPMPNNIKFFDYIHIGHFDQQTIDFLHQIQPLLLAADTKLYIHTNGIEPLNLDNLRAILDHIVPLLGGIDELKCIVRALPVVQQCFGEKLAKLNMIKAEAYGSDAAMTQATINFLMTWLNSAQQDGGIVGPKWCDILLWHDNGFSEQICTAIREDFLAAKNPSTFALFVCARYSQWQFVEFHLQNHIGEELHGVRLWHKGFKITRHKANQGTEMEEWIEANRAKFSTGKQSQIAIISPTVGQIGAMDMDVPEDEEQDQGKPSTSKET